MSQQKNPSNVIRGLKAAIHNPNVSDEAKQRDLQRLEEMGEDVSALSATSGLSATQEFDGPAGNTRRAPHVALKLDQHEEAMKEVAKQIIQEGEQEQMMDQDEAAGDQMEAQGLSTRVIAGYKATLSNPRTSEAAKEHAEEVLLEYGVST